MSDTSARMSLTDKATVLFGALSAAIACAVLILGDNVLKATYAPDIYVSTDTVALESFGSAKDHVRLFDFYNAGTAPSSNIKIVARFTNPDFKFTIESDEEVKSSTVRNSLLEISLERFSPRSRLRISALSKTENPLTEIYYIDDDGKTKMDPERRHHNDNHWIKVIAIFVTIAIVFWIAIIFIKRSENRNATQLQLTARELGDKLDQLKSDVAELRTQADDVPRIGAPTAGPDNGGAVEQRLHNLLNT
jgi:hypothetical protein